MGSINRLDGRVYNEMRPYSIEYGFINEASCTGSCRWQQGKSEVIASVHGPSQGRYMRFEQYDRGYFDIICDKLGSNSDELSKIKSLKLYLRNLFNSIIILEKYPRLLIHLKVEILHDDGSISANVFNASLVALLDAGIALKSAPLACSIAFYEETDTFLIDPTNREEKSAKSTITAVTYQNTMNESSKDIVLSIHNTGSINSSIVGKSTELCIEGVVSVRDFIRNLFVNN